ncbi:hypothetical protein QWY31_01765 [Cytophagales bacterium LB-30]|uniref:DUF2461 domain-containing protein n=1 Tax=Shiella aurantiaca TaxID=3058365 RepID=A0ABT8F174_9BACT|nr:hypothetical protein [Shiella aurantiaca]MDN4164205.1 hypothetical protein [Shiella aurantiaca]
MTENPLNQEELQNLSDSNFWLHFRNASKKIDELLEETQTQFWKINQGLSPILPSAAYRGKISRGNNHEGFPYLVLDCPNHYTTKDTFAFRVMVWWGKHITIGLHLEGHSFHKLKDSVLLASLAKDYWQNASNNPWTHQKEGYKKADWEPASDFSFLRLVQFYDLSEINQLTDLSINLYQDLFIPLHESLKADR